MNSNNTTNLNSNPSYDEVMTDARAFRTKINSEPDVNLKIQMEREYQNRIMNMFFQGKIDAFQIAILNKLVN